MRDVSNAKFAMKYAKPNDGNEIKETNYAPKKGLFQAGSVLIPRHGYRMQQNYRIHINVHAYIESHCIVATTKVEKRFSSYFLYNFLLTYDANKSATAHNTKIPKINKNDVENIKIPIFYAEEQQQIIKFFDTINDDTINNKL